MAEYSFAATGFAGGVPWTVVALEAIEAERIDAVQRVINDVGVAVPGLGVGGVDGGEAGGVGGRPAALIAVLAGGKIVEASDGVLALAGEGWVGGAGLGMRLAEWGVGAVRKAPGVSPSSLQFAISISSRRNQ